MGRRCPLCRSWRHTHVVDAIPAETLDYWTRLGIDVVAESRSIDARIMESCQMWDLSIVAGPLCGGLTSVVHQVRRARVDHALKVTPRAIDIGRDEGVALALWGGSGAVLQVMESTDRGTRLLEWLEHAGDVDDAEVAQLLGVLHQRTAPRADLPHLEARVIQMFTWARRMEQDLISPVVFRRCQEAARDLARVAPHPVLVHGDLQAKNVMRRSGQLVAIDPIPAVGDGAFDVALWSLTSPGYADAPARAAALSREVGHDPQRAVAWTRAMAAVVAAWPQDVTRRVACAAFID